MFVVAQISGLKICFVMKFLNTITATAPQNDMTLIVAIISQGINTIGDKSNTKENTITNKIIANQTKIDAAHNTTTATKSKNITAHQSSTKAGMTAKIPILIKGRFTIRYENSAAFVENINARPVAAPTLRRKVESVENLCSIPPTKLRIKNPPMTST